MARRFIERSHHQDSDTHNDYAVTTITDDIRLIHKHATVVDHSYLDSHFLLLSENKQHDDRPTNRTPKHADDPPTKTRPWGFLLADRYPASRAVNRHGRHPPTATTLDQCVGHFPSNRFDT